jgi:hypothetical protein
LSEQGAFTNEQQCKLFRKKLKTVQGKLRKYMGLLAEIAGVEDISSITQ